MIREGEKFVRFISSGQQNFAELERKNHKNRKQTKLYKVKVDCAPKTFRTRSVWWIKETKKYSLSDRFPSKIVELQQVHIA